MRRPADGRAGALAAASPHSLARAQVLSYVDTQRDFLDTKAD